MRPASSSPAALTPARTARVAALTLVFLTLSSCFSNKLARQRIAAEGILGAASRSIQAGDCATARRHVDEFRAKVPSFYPTLTFFAFFEERCGDWRGALEILLNDRDYHRRPTYKAIDALRILDEYNVAGSEREQYLERVLETLDDRSFGGIVRFSIYHERWSEAPNAENDYGWVSWLYRTTGRLSSSWKEGPSESPFPRSAPDQAISVVQPWIKKRLNWMSRWRTVMENSHEPAKARLLLLKAANIYRVRDWLGACDKSMLMFSSSRPANEVDASWTCGDPENCLVDPGSYSFKLYRRAAVAAPSPRRYQNGFNLVQSPFFMRIRRSRVWEGGSPDSTRSPVS